MHLLLVGASGEVGQAVLAQALADPRVAGVVALTRRPLTPANKLKNIVVDFDKLPEKAPWWAVDAVVCTLGTTLRAAGSKAKFAAVDRDLPLRIARLARAAGASRFALNSSLGADARSVNFYLRTKGEAEDAIRALGYPGYTVVRPSLIDADRAGSRPSEHLSLIFARALRPLIPGRWRAVTPAAIAHALLDAALSSKPVSRVIESDALHRPSPRVSG
ncbi:MAG: NAD-dependent dehydratase [Rhodocyclaceae bacterium]|nr:MAG: NAD-dependent dehydratase [Rhodocyclaceae bacterium]